MENGWNLAAIGTGRIALCASFFPLGAALVYTMARTYGATMAVLLSGGVLYGLAFVVTLVLLAIGVRGAGGMRSTAFGLLGGSILAFFAQIFLAIVIASGWSSTVEPSRSRSFRHRSPLPKIPAGRPNPSP